MKTLVLETPGSTSASRGGSSPRAPAVVAVAVFGCLVYANLSFWVSDPADYRFFPPFVPGVNANESGHLGGECYHIARSLAAGEGFAHPFGERTGPTAWMAPGFPAVLAGLLWVCQGDREAVLAAVVVAQAATIACTGLLVLALARRTTGRAGAGVAAVFLVALLSHFRLCFQWTHDSWLVLLSLNLLVAGWCWGRPLRSWGTALGWGVLGGLCALVSPVVGLTWLVLSLPAGVRGGARGRLAAAVLAAGLTVAPWAVRNALVFGRLVPVKSNLAFELYQSQCLQPDGVIQASTFWEHPYRSDGSERQEYREIGEIAFMDRKWTQFRDAVAADPWDFAKRVGERFLAATLVYVPFQRDEESGRPLPLWLGRLTHPLPFLSLLLLAAGAGRRPLHPTQWAVMGVYLAYLLPYVVIGYYDRYALPLLGVKVLLVVWGIDRLLSWRRGAPRREGESCARTTVVGTGPLRSSSCSSSSPSSAP